MTVPRRLHQIWVGNPIPRAQRDLVEHNRLLLGPSWEVRLWGNADITKENFPHTFAYIQKAMRIGKRRGKVLWAQISDLMRYEILYHHGGIYMDAGIQLVRPLDPLVERANRDGKKLIVANQDYGQACNPLDCGYRYRGVWRSYVSNSFIGSVPRGVHMGRAMDPTRLDKVDLTDTQVDWHTGPTFLRSLFRRGKSVMVVPSNRIYPFNWWQVTRRDGGRKILTRDRCVSYARPPTRHTIGGNQLKEKIYIELPCRRYPRAYAIKHWDLGASWVG